MDMRLFTIAMAVAVGVAVAGSLAAEDDSANGWFARSFAAKSADREADSKPAAPKTSSPPVRLRQAESDWHRRQEVCLALRVIADKLDDNELRQKVEVLEKRVWDAYLAASGLKRSPSRGPSLDAPSRPKESP